jgi:hypothetical protein
MPLEQEIEFFERNYEDLGQKYRGQFVLIKGKELIGGFPTVQEALAEGSRRFGLDSYLVRRVDVNREPVSIPALTLGLLRADPSHSTRGTHPKS